MRERSSAVRGGWCPDSESPGCSRWRGWRRTDGRGISSRGDGAVVRLQVDFKSATHPQTDSRVTPHGGVPLAGMFLSLLLEQAHATPCLSQPRCLCDQRPRRSISSAKLSHVLSWFYKPWTPAVTQGTDSVCSQAASVASVTLTGKLGNTLR